MPITGPTSYVSTTELFLTHWELADAALGAGNEVVLQGGITRANSQTMYDNLIAKRLDLTAKLNIEETGRGDIVIQKTALLLRLNQFNDLVRADFGGTKWEHALPLVPGIGDGQGVFVPALEDGATLWEQINAGIAPASPLSLLGGFLQATFAADIVALNTAYRVWRAAGLIAGLALQERNDIQDLIKPVLVLYRRKLPTKFAKNHALVDTLPDLSPAPGSTPSAVTINAVFNPATGMADITWNASTAGDLDHYEIRVCAGPNYNTELETVVGNVAAGGPLQFSTAAGLAAVGNVAGFKVYVITTTGNEKGSNAVNVLHAVLAP